MLSRRRPGRHGTVRYVNGFPAGGATDTLSRILCQKMSELSGQSFVVENRAGAGGVLGADAVAKSSPDGYTVGLGGIASNVLAIGSYAKLPYDPRGDFTFIGGMWQLPNILVARKDMFSSDIKELLAAFKKEPRKYTYASAGFGTTLHLSGEMMNSMAGVRGDPHSLQGRRPRADRSARRPRRFAVRQSARLAAERARRPGQAGRRHRHARAFPNFPTCRRWPRCCPAMR